MYSDLTGRFPHQSAQGFNYILIMYDYDGNIILVKSISNREAKTITTAWESNHKKILKVAAALKHHILDNEFSEEFKRSLEKYDVIYEKIPPNIHRHNSAERAVRTFKNQFLAGLASIDPSFPITQWDQLLEQAEITLNLLHVARVNPKLSAYAYLCGSFNFNKTPLARLGTKVAVHIKPGNCPSWGYYIKLGYYIGPTMEHYRCFK